MLCGNLLEGRFKKLILTISYLKIVVQPFAVSIVATQLALPLSPTERDFQNYEKMSRGVVE